jgi:hypothetical protein
MIKCPDCKEKMHIVAQGNHDPSTWRKRTRRTKRKHGKEIKTQCYGTLYEFPRVSQGPKVIRWEKIKAPSQYRIVLACRHCGERREYVGFSNAAVRRAIKAGP